jgi:hypothetical protein
MPRRRSSSASRPARPGCGLAITTSLATRPAPRHPSSAQPRASWNQFHCTPRPGGRPPGAARVPALECPRSGIWGTMSLWAVWSPTPTTED